MKSSAVRSRRLVGPLAAAALLLFLAPPAAHAHAKMLRSQPAASASLKEPPKAVELWFSEELEAQFSAVVVTDSNGRRVDKGSVRLAEGGKKLEAELEELPAGAYTVDWKALSTDQHMMNGKFSFTVEAARQRAAPADTSSAAKTEGKPPVERPGQMPEGMSEPSTQGPVSSWSMEIARWFEYLALMMLFGGFVFHRFILKPSLRKISGLSETGQSAAMSGATRSIVLFAWLSIVVLAITAMAALVLQTAVVNEKSFYEALQPALLSQVITASGFGAAWRLEVWALVALVIVLFYLSRGARATDTSQAHPLLLWAAIGFSAVLFIPPTWTGHAAAAEKEYRFAIAADWLHLAAGAVWVGGLFHLTLTLPRAVSGLGKRQRLVVIYRVIHLFTRTALLSVAVIVLTGLYNSWIHVGSLSALWQTPYGKTLLLKVLLVLPMLALGGLNTFVIHPRIKQELEREGESEIKSPNLDGSFYRSVALEALLGAVVLLVAAVLVFLQPAREHPVQMTESSSRASHLNPGD